MSSYDSENRADKKDEFELESVYLLTDGFELRSRDYKENYDVKKCLARDNKYKQCGGSRASSFFDKLRGKKRDYCKLCRDKGVFGRVDGYKKLHLQSGGSGPNSGYCKSIYVNLVSRPQLTEFDFLAGKEVVLEGFSWVKFSDGSKLSFTNDKNGMIAYYHQSGDLNNLIDNKQLIFKTEQFLSDWDKHLLKYPSEKYVTGYDSKPSTVNKVLRKYPCARLGMVIEIYPPIYTYSCPIELEQEINEFVKSFDD